MSSGLIQCRSLPGTFFVKLCMSLSLRLGITLASLQKIGSYSGLSRLASQAKGVPGGGTGRPAARPRPAQPVPDMGRAHRATVWTEPSNTSDLAPPLVPLWNRVTSGPGSVRYGWAGESGRVSYMSTATDNVDNSQRFRLGLELSVAEEQVNE